MSRIVLKTNEVELSAIENCLKGKNGEVLMDTLTDKFLLNESITVEERAGIGHVIKFLRDIRSGDRKLMLENNKPNR